MKVDYNEASQFIKNKLNIQLFPYQEIMLKAFCDGLSVCSGRGVGRSFVADAFGQYIAYLYGKNIQPDDSDVVIPMSAAVHNGLMPEVFARKKAAMQEEYFEGLSQ